MIDTIFQMHKHLLVLIMTIIGFALTVLETMYRLFRGCCCPASHEEPTEQEITALKHPRRVSMDMHDIDIQPNQRTPPRVSMVRTLSNPKSSSLA